jgi:hypothetical protein
MPAQDLLAVIPGYREALGKEQLVRDACFLPVTESVAGFELRPMTLRDYLVLKSARSPLLAGRIPSPDQLLAFLWQLSPWYRPRLSLATIINRRLFVWHCRRLLPLREPRVRWKMGLPRWQEQAQKRLERAARLVLACREYVKETFQDAPPSSSRAQLDPQFWGDAVALCAVLGREFGWTEDYVLAMPLKRIFQYLKEIGHAHGAKVPLCNPSDAVKADWLRSVNRRN